jgi:hypothetical protein
VIFDSFREPTVAFIPVASPLQNEPNSQQRRSKLVGTSMIGEAQHGARYPRVVLELVYHSAADSSGNDHREHVLFRVVRECDKNGSYEGARGLLANLLNPYGDTSSTWMTRRLKGSGLLLCAAMSSPSGRP